MLPLLGFAVAFFLTAWLWQRERYLPNMIGEVEAMRVDVASGSDGILARLAHIDSGHWSLFDRVQRNEIVARLDDGPTLASLATMRAELARLSVEVDAEKARLKLDDALRHLDVRRERARLAWQIEGDRLARLDRRVLIEVDRIEKERLETQLGFWEPLGKDRIIPEQVLVDARFQLDKIVKQIETNEAALAEIEKQRKQAVARLEELPDTKEGDEVALLAPLKAATSVQEASINELHVQIDHLAIRAPKSGTITAIYKHPGQAISAGDPIVTIATEQGRYIVGYVRGRRLRPTKGGEILVRLRATGALRSTAAIQRVGPQVELVPVHHLLDHNTPEWGVPIRVSIPHNFPGKPGELVDLTLVPRRS